MNWVKRHPAPTVPNDVEERVAALQQSQAALDESISRGERVDKVVSSLDHRNRVNHYVRGIRMSYAREAKSA